MQFWGHGPLIFSSLAHNQSFKLWPPSLWRHPLQLLCPQMKGSIDVENCCLVISYIPLSRISAVLLLRLRDTAEKSGLKFHRWRGRLRRNKSGFNTTNISNYQMWAEKHKKQGEIERPLVFFKASLWGWKSLFEASQAESLGSLHTWTALVGPGLEGKRAGCHRDASHNPLS